MKNLLKSLGWLALNVVLQIVVQFIFSLYTAANGIESSNMNEWLMNRLLVITILSNLLFVLTAVLICRCRHIPIRTEWRLEKSRLKVYCLPCAITFTYAMFFSFITYDSAANLSSATHISASHYGLFGLLILMLALLISAPVTEEILCRGLIMNTLKRSFSAKAAILISSLLFGAMHIMAGGIVLGLGAFTMGLLLAFIYEKTASLSVTIAAHTAANLPDLILYPSPVIGQTVKITIATVSLAASLVFLFLWCHIQRASRQKSSS